MAKILVVAPSWIGDTVLAQPLFRRLHELHANLVLEALAPPWTLPVLQYMPEVNEILSSPFRHGKLDLTLRMKLAKKIKMRAYDEAIVLPNSWKSALLPFFAGIPKRTGYTGEARWGILNNRTELDKTARPLMVQRFYALSGDEAVSACPPPLLVIGEEERLAVLEKFRLGSDIAMAVLCIGAEFGPAKRWPAKHFSQLARNLSAQHYVPILLGSKADVGYAQEISLGCGESCLNLCGATTLNDAVALLASASLVVSNDSGLMHIAAALNKPLLALFGSSSPEFTPPLSPHAKILSLNLPCSPCFERVCPLGHFRCMEDMTPALVLDKIAGLSGPFEEHKGRPVLHQHLH